MGLQAGKAFKRPFIARLADHACHVHIGGPASRRHAGKACADAPVAIAVLDGRPVPRLTPVADRIAALGNKLFADVPRHGRARYLFCPAVSSIWFAVRPKGRGNGINKRNSERHCDGCRELVDIAAVPNLLIHVNTLLLVATQLDQIRYIDGTHKQGMMKHGISVTIYNFSMDGTMIAVCVCVCV